MTVKKGLLVAIRARRIRERKTRVQEIQKAAKEIFFQKGYQNSTVEEIAQRADISKGTIYLYFKNKNDLYVSLILPVTEKLNEDLKAFELNITQRRPKTCADLIRGFYEVFYKAYLYDSDALRVFQAFQLGNLFRGMSEEIYKEFLKYGKENFKMMRRICSKAIKIGLIANTEPVKLVDVLWASFLGIIQVEEAKLWFTKKNHISDTLEYSFSLISKSLFPENLDARKN